MGVYAFDVTRLKSRRKARKIKKKACQSRGDLVKSCTAFSPGGIQVPHELPGRGLGGDA